MQALWDTKGETQEERKTDNLQNKGNSITRLAKNIKTNLFIKSTGKFMALLKPTGVTKVTVCSGEKTSSMQTKKVSPPLPTILGCPD